MSFSATLQQPSQLIAASVGIPGPPGTDGADGSQWFTGTGAPAPALGSPGDMYLENDGDVWQSSDASGWLVTPTNIRGPVGATGATGATGSAGAQGPAGSVSSVGSHLLFSPDATYDIGQSGASRPRNLYLAGTATVGGSVVTAFLTSTGNLDVTSQTGAITFVVQGAPQWYIGPGGTTHFIPGADNANDIGRTDLRPRNLYLAGTAILPTIWAGNGTAAAPSITFNTDRDTGIYLSAYQELGFSTAGVLRFYIHSNGNMVWPADNTYDIGYASNQFRPRNLYLAGTATVGGTVYTPTVRGSDLTLWSDSSTLYLIAAANYQWQITGSALLASSDNATDIGDATHRPRNLYLAGTATVGGIASATGMTVSNVDGKILMAGALGDKINLYDDGSYKFGMGVQSGKMVFYSPGTFSWAAGNTSTASEIATLSASGNLYLAGTASIAGVPAFAAGDKYLVIDASGNIHRSALGPAS